MNIKTKQFIYACFLLLSFTPAMSVKLFHFHTDAAFHVLYPDDEEQAHREAAKAIEDCPFCHITLSQFVVTEDSYTPYISCEILREHCCYLIKRVTTFVHQTLLRAPPFGV